MADPRPLPPLWTDAAVVTGLWALGGAEPLLELLGRNPTFFVAARASDGRILAFMAVVLLVVPLAATALLALSRCLPSPVPALTRTGLLTCGAALVGLAVGRLVWGDSTAGHIAIAAGVVAFVLTADRRWPRVVEAMRYTSAAVIVFGGLFLLSPAGALIGGDEARVAQDVDIGRPDDVVLIVLDELPTASLLDDGGRIAADRFPGFAHLADSSTWYRNAVSDFTYTTEAVPAILSGRVEESPPAPTGADYPRNIFTLLGGRYRVDGREELTSLCPPDLCAPAEESFGRMLRDSWVVLRHQTLPLRWRDDLPPIDQGWGAFAGAGDTRADPLDDPFDAWVQRQAKVTSRTAYRTEPLERLAETLAEPPGDRPELHVVHAVLPHLPWEREPGGALYTTSAESDVPVDASGTWTRNENALTSAFQRHLLQVGHVDRLIGNIVGALESSDRWDDTVVVVVADHGVTFTAGTHRRAPTRSTLDEVYRVPLFVHVPGGPAGEVSDDLVHNGDVLPTIVDALDISTDWTFTGRSLLRAGAGPVRTTVQSREGPHELHPTLEGLFDVVERNTRRLPTGFDWQSVAAPGPAGRLVGSTVDDLDVTEGTGRVVIERYDQLTRIDRSSGYVPAMVEADFDGDEPPDQLLIALDGVIRGSALADHDEGSFTAILDPAWLTDGAHDVAVLGWTAGELTRLTLGPGLGVNVEAGELTIDGKAARLITDRDIDFELDRANRVDDEIALWGWSVDPTNRRAPALVVLFDDERVLATDDRLTASTEAADEHGERLAYSRFSVRGPDRDGLKLAAVYPDGVVVRDV